MTETPHTPTPWEYHSDGGGWSDVFVGNKNDRKYAGRMRTPLAKKATECVNSHAALVEACKAVIDLEVLDEAHQSHCEAADQLRAALKLAGEG